MLPGGHEGGVARWVRGWCCQVGTKVVLQSGHEGGVAKWVRRWCCKVGMRVLQTDVLQGEHEGGGGLPGTSVCGDGAARWQGASPRPGPLPWPAPDRAHTGQALQPLRRGNMTTPR